MLKQHSSKTRSHSLTTPPLPAVVASEQGIPTAWTRVTKRHVEEPLVMSAATQPNVFLKHMSQTINLSVLPLIVRTKAPKTYSRTSTSCCRSSAVNARTPLYAAERKAATMTANMS